MEGVKKQRLQNGEYHYPIRVQRKGTNVEMLLHLGDGFKVLKPEVRVKEKDGSFCYRPMTQTDVRENLSVGFPESKVLASVIVQYDLHSPKKTLNITPVVLSDRGPAQLSLYLAELPYFNEQVEKNIRSTLDYYMRPYHGMVSKVGVLKYLIKSQKTIIAQDVF